MQPIKLVIRGDYYDCQIYRGRLYLWTFDGDLKVYDWNELVKSLIKKDTDKIAITSSFQDNRYLYEPSLAEIFQDKDFKELLIGKFKNIEKEKYYFTEKQIEDFLFGEQETPKGILPIDTEIYGNNLYFITEEGLFSSSAHRARSKKYPVSSRPNKYWDCRLLTIKANKYPQLALSGGDEGLFELNLLGNNLPANLDRVENSKSIFQISRNHSSSSNYFYLNIYNTSLIGDPFLAIFKLTRLKKDKNIKDKNINEHYKYRRDFNKIIKGNKLFKSKTEKDYISWGIENRIYRVKNNGFEAIEYIKNAKKGEKKFRKLKDINLPEWKSQVIDGGTAPFGNIIECENELVIVQSNNKILTIPGPITRWRIYPRSLNYQNHLHAILDDRIEIYSFYHDYFLNQSEKRVGIQIETQTNKRFIRRKKPTHFNEREVWIDETDYYVDDSIEDDDLIDDDDIPQL